MNICLLDVNVLIALMWPAHEAHSAVQAWFVKTAAKGWATCPFTETGFVRIISNPAFSPHAVTPAEALETLTVSLQHKGHRFWKDDISFAEAIEPFRERVAGHRQVTDGYLLGLAIENKGRLATLDRSIATLIKPEDDHRSIEVIDS